MERRCTGTGCADSGAGSDCGIDIGGGSNDCDDSDGGSDCDNDWVAMGLGILEVAAATDAVSINGIIA